MIHENGVAFKGNKPLNSVSVSAIFHPVTDRILLALVYDGHI